MRLSKLIEWLFYLFIFLLPWQTRWIFKDISISGSPFEYGRFSLYGTEILLIILLILTFIKSIKNETKGVILNPDDCRGEGSPTNVGPTCVGDSSARTSPQNDDVHVSSIKNIEYLIFGFGLWALLTIFWSQDKMVAWYWSLKLFEGISLVWLLIKINFSYLKLALSFVMGAVIQSSLGIWQFLTQSTFQSKWLGMAYHSASVLGDSVVETVSGRWLRAYGSFPHPNILAGYLVIVIIFLFWLSHEYFSNKARIDARIRSRILIPVFLYGSIAFSITGLFFTFSRGAWISLFIGLLVYLFIGLLKTFDKSKGSWLKQFKHWQLKQPVLYICLLLTAYCLLFWPLVKTRFQFQERLEVKSNIERVVSYRESWQIIKENSLIGIGLGNYTIKLQKINPGQPTYIYQPVHNTYLLVLAELGIIGFILFISLLIYLFITILPRAKLKFTQMRIGRFALPRYLLFVICFLFLFDHYFWTLAFGMWLFCLVVGLNIKIFSSSFRQKDLTSLRIFA